MDILRGAQPRIDFRRRSRLFLGKPARSKCGKKSRLAHLGRHSRSVPWTGLPHGPRVCAIQRSCHPTHLELSFAPASMSYHLDESRLRTRQNELNPNHAKVSVKQTATATPATVPRPAEY